MSVTRAQVERWLHAAVESVNPAELTRSALDGPPATVVAIGKAAVGMCRGAAEALGSINGVCVADTPGEVPESIDLVIGDHPIPGIASLEAGRRVLKTIRQARGRIVVLVSGGGSALCEMPRAGIDFSFIQNANRILLKSGASINELNLIRGHLSAIKCGGLARAAGRPIETLIISDVAGSGPEMVGSGPTIPMKFEPSRALETMKDHGLEVPDQIWDVMSRSLGGPGDTTVQVLADGKDAANAAAAAARSDQFEATVSTEWISGPLAPCLTQFLAAPKESVTFAAGEATLEVTGSGSGGRNSHAALLAASHVADSDAMFAAFATDGIDGASGSAGAIVDGSTTLSGGDPAPSLANFDSAGYLKSTGALLPAGATGTNVSDLWMTYRCDRAHR